MESEVADGLIEYLQATNPPMATKLTMERLNLIKQIATLSTRLAELEAALRPFAKAAVWCDETGLRSILDRAGVALWSPASNFSTVPTITYAHCDAARAALDKP